MVKLLLFISFLSVNIYSNIFEKDCLSCHKNKKELKLFMIHYTLSYSSEKKIKEAIFNFLKSPISHNSIMPASFIMKYGFKNSSTLNDKELKKAINIYYQKYNLKQFIR